MNKEDEDAVKRFYEPAFSLDGTAQLNSLYFTVPPKDNHKRRSSRTTKESKKEDESV